MSYMYNALNCNNYNGLPINKKSISFTSKDNSRPVVGAPSYIPKYSIENELNKREQFRNGYNYGNTGRKGTSIPALQKVAIVSSFAAVALLALSKK